MVCYSPMKAYPGREINAATRKRPRTFSGTKSLVEGMLYTLPCGNCLGCRIDRAEGWAIRCAHEAQMVNAGAGSAFLTLTYRDECLPVDNSISLEVSQKFIRDLRYRVGDGVTIRYLGCGEYGERKGRAHYHFAVFGFAFPDRVLWKTTPRGDRLYSSELLSLAWPYGNAFLGNVTYESARYIASYVMKKRGGDQADAYYHRAHPQSGEFFTVEPEFQVMSKKPGLGASWLAEFKADVYPADHVILDGKPKKPPRFYDKQLSEAEFAPILQARKRRSVLAAAERTRERLKVRGDVKYLSSLRFARELDV
jgi:hypothetical protein